MASHHQFPRLFAAVTELIEGFSLTVYLRTSPSGDGLMLVINDPTDTIDAACAIVGRLARERSIEEPPSIEFYLSDERRLGGLVH